MCNIEYINSSKFLFLSLWLLLPPIFYITNIKQIRLETNRLRSLELEGTLWSWEFSLTVWYVNIIQPPLFIILLIILLCLQMSFSPTFAYILRGLDYIMRIWDTDSLLWYICVYVRGQFRNNVAWFIYCTCLENFGVLILNCSLFCLQLCVGNSLFSWCLKISIYSF